jgi:hypothetical protein
MKLFVCRICSCAFHITYTSELNDTEYHEPEECRARTRYCPNCGANSRMQVVTVFDVEVLDEETTERRESGRGNKEG